MSQPLKVDSGPSDLSSAYGDLPTEVREPMHNLLKEFLKMKDTIDHLKSKLKTLEEENATLVTKLEKAAQSATKRNQQLGVKIIDDKALSKLSESMGNDSEKFSIQMLSIAISSIEQYQMEHKRVSAWSMEALKEWRRKQGRCATVLCLVNLLHKFGMDRIRWQFLMDDYGITEDQLEETGHQRETAASPVNNISDQLKNVSLTDESGGINHQPSSTKAMLQCSNETILPTKSVQSQPSTLPVHKEEDAAGLTTMTDGEPSVIKSAVTAEHMGFIAEHLNANNWQTYMRTLGVDDYTMDDKKHDYHNNAYEQRYQTLLSWKKDEGLKASPESFVKAALKKSNRFLAEEFCEKFQMMAYIKDYDAKEKAKKYKRSSNSTSNMRSLNDDHSMASSTTMHSTILGSGDSFSDTMSFSGQHSYVGPQQDEAVPVSTFSGPRGLLSSYGKGPPHSLPLSTTIQTSLLLQYLTPYAKSTTDAYKIQTELTNTKIIPKCLDMLIIKLVENQPEEEFKTRIQSGKLKRANNWRDVCEYWALCVKDSSVGEPGTRPPIFLWNMCQSLCPANVNIVYIFQKWLKPGSIGPSLPHKCLLSHTKWSLLNKVGADLNCQIQGAADWRKLAEILGFSSEIALWMQAGKGGHNCIESLRTSGKTLGDLYEQVYELNRIDIVKVMEDAKWQ